MSTRTDAEAIATAFLATKANKATRTGYERSVREWFSWCELRRLSPLEATGRDIEAWGRALSARGNRAATVASKFNAVAGYYREAELKGAVPQNPMRDVKRPSLPRHSTTASLTRVELQAILAAAEDHSPRMHAITCLLGLTGLRISEAVSIEIGDIAFARDSTTLRLRRDGGTQSIKLPSRTAWAVTALIGARETGPLFNTKTGKPVTRNQVGKELARIAKNAGITKTVSPHTLRGTYTSLATEAGVPLEDVLASIGNADARSVAYYVPRNDLYHDASSALERYVQDEARNG